MTSMSTGVRSTCRRAAFGLAFGAALLAGCAHSTRESARDRTDADPAEARLERQRREGRDGETQRREITAILEAQAAAWNRGDVDGFMQHYWKSDTMTFSSGGQVERGWAATLERYRRKYPTPERMGRVSFTNLEMRRLGGRAALVLGAWQLDRPPDSPGGVFTLVFENIDGRWVITHDHTSTWTAP
jgi:uncharacterized protein (TIGR02246 family)